MQMSDATDIKHAFSNSVYTLIQTVSFKQSFKKDMIKL